MSTALFKSDSRTLVDLWNFTPKFKTSFSSNDTSYAIDSVGNHTSSFSLILRDTFHFINRSLFFSTATCTPLINLQAAAFWYNYELLYLRRQKNSISRQEAHRSGPVYEELCLDVPTQLQRSINWHADVRHHVHYVFVHFHPKCEDLQYPSLHLQFKTDLGKYYFCA